jgi:hypothetical protein
LAVRSKRWSEWEKGISPFLVAIWPASQGDWVEVAAGAVESALQAVQAVKNLPLPSLIDPLEPHRRDVDRHPILESRAEQSVYMGVGRPVLTTVLMHSEHALSATDCTSEGLRDGIAQNAFA